VPLDRIALDEIREEREDREDAPTSDDDRCGVMLRRTRCEVRASSRKYSAASGKVVLITRGDLNYMEPGFSAVKPKMGKRGSCNERVCCKTSH
jgi:hypothetical protein